MPSLAAIKIDVPPGLEKALDGASVYDAIAEAIPPAYQPLLFELSANAPVASGKMAAAGFRVVVERVSAGLIQGIEARVVSGVRYAHLPAFGHQIIPRGPSRKGRRLKREQRAALRANLQRRRAEGATGFVAPDPWVIDAAEQLGPQVVEGIERQLAARLGG